MEEYKVGEYVIYVNGDRYELGRIKSLTEDGAFVCYHEGETASKTPYDLIHKLVNGFTIADTTIGGETFKEYVNKIKNLKKCSSVDLDIMLKACANAVSDRVEDGSALFISDKDGKYEKYEWMTILDWICDVHSELCEVTNYAQPTNTRHNYSYVSTGV